MDDNKNPINVDVNVSAKADLAPIIKATPKGFAYLSFLLFGKREANNERYLRLSKAQTDIDEKGILEGRLIFNTKENTLSSTNQDLKQQIVDAIQDEEIQNLIACSIKAAENIKEGETEKEPSQDFINRWRNDAKQIHGEELQNIWGRLMAEEINSPNSISLRTLDVVKNISRSEAESFVALLKYIMEVRSYPESYGIQIYMGWSRVNQTDLLLADASASLNLKLLKEAGLFSDIKFDYKKSFSLGAKQINGEYAYYIETINYIFFIPECGIHLHPNIRFMSLTRAGEDIFKILCADRDCRMAKRQDAISFIKVIKDELVYCGAHYIYFGYKEINGQVKEWEKYSL